MRSRDLPTEVGFVSQKEAPPGRVLLGIVRDNGELETTLDDSLNLYACILNDGPFSRKKLVNVGEAGAIVQAAKAFGVPVPDGFIFESGQVFLEGATDIESRIVEVRLSGFIVKDSLPGFESWSTDVRPKLLVREQGTIDVTGEDKGRKHLSAKVLTTKQDPFLLSLRENTKATSPVPLVVYRDGPSIVNTATMEFASDLRAISWPRKASEVLSWEQESKEQVELFLKKHGESAAEGHLIKRARNGGWELGDKGIEILKDQYRHRWWFIWEKKRRVGWRRYLMKCLHGVDVKISLCNDAKGLVAEYQDAEEEKVRRELLDVEENQPGFSFYEQEIKDRLTDIQARRDALDVMVELVHWFGNRGRNPDFVPMIRLRQLLDCHRVSDKHGPAKVRAAIDVLSEIRLVIQRTGDTPLNGNFLDLHQEVPLGPGRTEGGWFIKLGDMAIGGLRAFEQSKFPESVIPKVPLTVYDFKKRLPKASVEALRKEPFRRKPSYNTFLYASAERLSRHQRGLVNWVESNITKTCDDTCKGREHLKGDKSDTSPRLYSHDFCSVLPEGSSFVGALGSFKSNPKGGAELGRKLTGVPTRASKDGRSGGREGGLLYQMGMGQPRGPDPNGKRQNRVLSEALEQIKGVVEGYYGGVVAIRHKDRWYRLSEARRMLTAEELLDHATFFLFLAPDWLERLRERFNASKQKEVEQGEVDTRLVIVASTAPEHPQERPLKDRLREALRSREMSQAALARELGVSTMTVSKWLSGSIPQREAREALEDWLQKAQRGGASHT